MKMFLAVDTSASGLTAERLRMDVISHNIANVNTTRTPQGGPYKHRHVLFEPRGQQPKFTLPFSTDNKLSNKVGEGVRVVKIEESDVPPRLEYRPDHPDADKNGYVHMPNINIVMEMTDLITATRAYEANASVIRAFKTMMQKALQIAI
ncbi:MAG: flagellar basal body rod protein FlgC [bacterium]|nr:flagellar basal body rod protein FlgC [bacterium]